MQMFLSLLAPALLGVANFHRCSVTAVYITLATVMQISQLSQEFWHELSKGLVSSSPHSLNSTLDGFELGHNPILLGPSIQSRKQTIDTTIFTEVAIWGARKAWERGPPSQE